MERERITRGIKSWARESRRREQQRNVIIITVRVDVRPLHPEINPSVVVACRLNRVRLSGREVP